MRVGRKEYYCAVGAEGAPEGPFWPVGRLGRTCMLVAVTEPSAFADPLTTTDCPAVSVEAGTLCISLTVVLVSKSTILVPVVADVLVDCAS